MKMNFNFIFSSASRFSSAARFLGAAFCVLFTARVAGAQEPSIEELRKAVAALEADVRRLVAEAAGGSEQAKELERRIDLLAAEIEKGRTGRVTAPETQTAQPVPGLGPAASKVYASSKGVSIGGYGEVVFQRFAKARQDGVSSEKRDQIDFLRNVVYVGYKFSDKILFNSELEFEHATTGTGPEERGEISVEFGYLEFRPWKSAGIRAGMLLVPVGFVNEIHEAPVFHGSRRPEVEQEIIPTTWRENGIGIFGESGPVRWRAYAVAGLSSAGFVAGGIGEGRQEGSRSLAEDVALTARADFVGTPGLLAGASIFSGKSGQGANAGGTRIDGRVTLFDLHAQYERRGLQLRALYAGTRVGDGALINRQNGLTGEASVGERQFGWYVEAAYDVTTVRPSGRWSVTPFLRYERLNTQERVPAGFAANPSNDQTAWTAGIGIKPLTNVVLKADYQWLTNRARTGTNQVNLGVGYLF